MNRCFSFVTAHERPFLFPRYSVSSDVSNDASEAQTNYSFFLDVSAERCGLSYGLGFELLAFLSDVLHYVYAVTVHLCHFLLNFDGRETHFAHKTGSQNKFFFYGNGDPVSSIVSELCA